MNTLVVYSSKTGFTEKYAGWIREMVPCTCVKVKEADKIDTEKYDVIIYGGGFYGGQIQGIAWLKSRIPQLKGKRTAVFATGASPKDSPEVEKAFAQNFTKEQRQAVSCFYMQSGLDYEKMDWKARMMMKMFAKMMEKKKDKSEQEKMMAAHLKTSFDVTDKNDLNPLIHWIMES